MASDQQQVESNLTTENEFKQIFKNLLINLKENFNNEFDQMELYKNVGRLEKKITKTVEKFEKINFNKKLNSYLDDCIESVRQEQKQLENNDIIDGDTIEKLKQFLENENQIEKLNEMIVNQEIKQKIIQEEMNDLDLTMKYFKENQNKLSNYRAQLKDLQNNFDKCLNL